MGLLDALQSPKPNWGWGSYLRLVRLPCRCHSVKGLAGPCSSSKLAKIAEEERRQKAAMQAYRPGSSVADWRDSGPGAQRQAAAQEAQAEGGRGCQSGFEGAAEGCSCPWLMGCERCQHRRSTSKP